MPWALRKARIWCIYWLWLQIWLGWWEFIEKGWSKASFAFGRRCIRLMRHRIAAWPEVRITSQEDFPGFKVRIMRVESGPLGPLPSISYSKASYRFPLHHFFFSFQISTASEISCSPRRQSKTKLFKTAFGPAVAERIRIYLWSEHRWSCTCKVYSLIK